MSRRLEYFIVSESVALDAVSQRESIFHVLHGIVAAKIPFAIPRVSASAMWIDDELSPDRPEQKVFIEVISPKQEGKDAIVNRFERTLNSDRRFEHVLFSIVNIPIPAEGDLKFRLLLDDDEVGTYTVDVSEDAVEAASTSDVPVSS